MARILLTIIVLCLHFMQVNAQKGIEYSIDSLLSEWLKPDMPGMSVAVIKKGKVLFQRNYGMENIQNGRKVDSLTRFWISSVTKQFTAAGIYLLEERKQINPDLSIRHYLKDLPPVFDSITIDQLIHHTSGIRDGFVLTALAKNPEENYTNENVIRYLKQQTDYNFNPGTEYEYNNSEYVLLAKLIENVTSTLFPLFMKENIFDPLRMNNTYISGKYEPAEHLAEGYISQDGSNTPASLIPAHFKGNTYGSTGVISTAGDLIRWEILLQNPKKMPAFARIVEKLLITGKLKKGVRIAYGGGLEKFNYRGEPVYEHSGADPGFNANILFFPASGLSIIGLTNSSSNYGLSRNLYAIADIIKGRRPLIEESITEKEEPLFIADYYSGEGLPIFRRVKKFNNYIKISESPASFGFVYMKNMDEYINADPIPRKYQYVNRDKINIIDPYYHSGVTIPELKTFTNLSDLKSFAGEYYSPELNESYRILHKEDHLEFEFVPGVNIPLHRLTAQDFTFDYTGPNYLQFQGDGFKFSREGCRRLLFKRRNKTVNSAQKEFFSFIRKRLF